MADKRIAHLPCNCKGYGADAASIAIIGAAGANVSGQIASVIAGGPLLALVKAAVGA